MSYTINPNAKNRWARNAENTMDLSLETDASSVYLDNGRTLEQEIGEGSMVSNVATVDTSMSKVIDGTLDGAYESLMFKGKSLVNLVTYSKRQNVNVQNLLDSNGRLSWNTTGVWGKIGFTVQGKPNSTYCVKYSDKHTTLGFFVRYMDGLSGTTQPITTLNSTCRKFTTDTTGIFTLTLEQSEATTDSWIQDFMILEYQEGMENWDIPYFEGLCDVKMPILRNTGKNLLNSQSIIYTFSNTSTEIKMKNSLKPNVTYTISFDRNGISWAGRSFYVKGEGFSSYRTTKDFDSKRAGITFSLTDEEVNVLNNDDKSFIQLYSVLVTSESLRPTNIQIEESPAQTTYEPHKSNILRTSEEIVLREVGGVCDTYNPLTGKYVKRIKEITFDGSSDENWGLNTTWSSGDYCAFWQENTKDKLPTGYAICDKLPSKHDNHLIQNGVAISEGWRYAHQNMYIFIAKNKLSSADTNGLRQHLSQNPITVQYELAEPITTIVESLTTPFAYQNGHVILESGYEGQSLLPTLEYSTVVNKTGLVENVAKTIQRQEKQLTMLEQMLIQNIINLDYNNTLLTLKNEMEEML